MSFREPPTVECPDRTSCRHCGKIIVWDDWCYVHENGWANCGVRMVGGDVLAGVGVAPMTFVFDPQIVTDLYTRAEPADWDYYGTR